MKAGLAGTKTTPSFAAAAKTGASPIGSRPGDEPIAETEPAAGEHCGDAVGLGVEFAEGHDLIPEIRGGPAGHRPGRIGEDGTDA